MESVETEAAMRRKSASGGSKTVPRPGSKRTAVRNMPLAVRASDWMPARRRCSGCMRSRRSAWNCETIMRTVVSITM